MTTIPSDDLFTLLMETRQELRDLRDAHGQEVATLRERLAVVESSRALAEHDERLAATIRAGGFSSRRRFLSAGVATLAAGGLVATGAASLKGAYAAAPTT